MGIPDYFTGANAPPGRNYPSHPRRLLIRRHQISRGTKLKERGGGGERARVYIDAPRFGALSEDKRQRGEEKDDRAGEEPLGEVTTTAKERPAGECAHALGH